MIRHLLTRFITGFALFFATLAWTGWAYLHTAGDPHRSEVIARAVLDDAEARTELAEPLADQIVDLAGLDATVAPQIHDAVVATMADPRIAANLIGAVGAAHARSFGVPDSRSTTIDGAALVAAVRDHLGAASPDLAARIPADLVGDITVPEAEIPLVGGLRKLAESTTEWFGAAAIGLLTFSLIAGDRRRTLWRYGFWAIATGLVWAIGPRLVVFLVHRFAESVDATVAAGVHAATKTVTLAASVLVATGIAALVLSHLIRFAPSGGPSPARPPRRRRDTPTMAVGQPRSAVTTVTPVVPTPVVPAAPPSSVPPIVTSPPTTVLPFEPTTQTPVVPPGAREPVRAGDLPLAPAPVPPVPDVDPWAHFAGPAVEPSTGEPLPRRVAPDPDEPFGA